MPAFSDAIGAAGGKNAAIFAAQIMALADEKLAKRLVDFKAELAA